MNNVGHVHQSQWRSLNDIDIRVYITDTPCHKAASRKGFYVIWSSIQWLGEYSVYKRHHASSSVSNRLRTHTRSNIYVGALKEQEFNTREREGVNHNSLVHEHEDLGIKSSIVLLNI